MYARSLKNQTLTLSVSGMLWNRSLVMVDQPTGSLWSHILGRAMRGKLKGATLEVIPSTMTDWGTWRKLHPKTTVVTLSRTARVFRREFYRNAARFVLGVAVRGGPAKAWTFARLDKQPVLNEQLGEQSLVVFFDRPSKTALTFDRVLMSGQPPLKFRLQDGQIVDAGTGSVWDPLRGRATSGPLQGKQLRPIPSLVSFTRAWVQFHPKTQGLTKAEIERAKKRPPRRRKRRSKAEKP